MTDTVSAIATARTSIHTDDAAKARLKARYATERRTFNKPLAEHGQIQKYIAESYAKVEAMRALIYNVAAEVGPQNRNRLGTDAAKLFAATAAKEVADAAVQVLGGEDEDPDRYLRDVRTIGEALL